MYTEEVNHASIQMNGTGRIQEDFDVGLIQGDTTSMYTGDSRSCIYTQRSALMYTEER